MIAPFPDRCLLVPFLHGYIIINQSIGLLLTTSIIDTENILLVLIFMRKELSGDVKTSKQYACFKIPIKFTLASFAQSRNLLVFCCDAACSLAGNVRLKHVTASQNLDKIVK